MLSCVCRQSVKWPPLTPISLKFLFLFLFFGKIERERERETDRQTNRQPYTYRYVCGGVACVGGVCPFYSYQPKYNNHYSNYHVTLPWRHVRQNGRNREKNSKISFWPYKFQKHLFFSAILSAKNDKIVSVKCEGVYWVCLSLPNISTKKK